MTNAASLTWTLADILKATGGRLLTAAPEHTFDGIAIDSRNIAPTELFVAIEGQFHDGHTFIDEVVRRGVNGIIAAEGKVQAHTPARWQEAGGAIILVEDTTRALGDLAAYHRRRAGVSVVAITGSNGKTTTREMTAAVLSQSYRVLATSGNLNNQIGLPLTLLQLTADHQWAVLELGMNHPGEIRRLTEICGPDIGVITNIGPAHLEGLGSMDGVMHAKGELLASMRPQGAAVLNADDRRVLSLAPCGPRRITLFGRSEAADIIASEVRALGPGSRFRLSTPSAGIDAEIGLPGDFMISNALAAAAVGYVIGIPLTSIRDGLKKVRPLPGRMNIIHTAAGVHVIDDAYNANPASMAAAIQNLRRLSGRQRRVLVAGDMLELGSRAGELHRQIGALAGGSQLSRLYLSGEHAGSVSQGAREKGMASGDIYTGSRQKILMHLLNWLRPGDWVLVKGSRAAGLETIVQGLTDGPHDQT